MVLVPEAPADLLDGPAGVGCEADSSTLLTRIFRCMGVSVVSTVVSVTILAATTVGLGLAAWLANVVAVGVATFPSYHLNRRWTWGKRDSSSMWREVAPFWALSFAGLVLSTITVALTNSWTHSAQLGSPLLHTALLVIAHLSGFGLLWIAQFVLLERVLFVNRAPALGAPPVQLPPR